MKADISQDIQCGWDGECFFLLLGGAFEAGKEGGKVEVPSSDKNTSTVEVAEMFKTSLTQCIRNFCGGICGNEMSWTGIDFFEICRMDLEKDFVRGEPICQSFSEGLQQLFPFFLPLIQYIDGFPSTKEGSACRMPFCLKMLAHLIRTFIS